MMLRLSSLFFFCAVLASCGGSSSTDTGPTTDAPVLGTIVDVSMEDFLFTLSRSSVPAGTVTFNGVNNGTHVHEMVIARTDLAADMLPQDTTTLRQVDEAMLDIPGEIPETDPGMSQSLTLDLTPGNYVLFCNFMDHYSRGMYVAFTVTAP